MVRKQPHINEDLNDAVLRQYLRREHRDPADGKDTMREMIGLVDDQDGPDDVTTQHDRRARRS